MTRRGPSRNCKRRWPYQGSLDGGATSKRSKNESLSYFNTLSEDMLDNVMKQSSEKPLSKQWADYLTLQQVQMFFDDMHPLEQTARNRLTVLMACDMYPYERRGLLVHGKGGNAIQGFRNTAFSLSDVVTDVYIYQAAFPPTWRKTLTHCCPNLKSLSMNSASMVNIFPLVPILRAHSGKLESVEVTWGEATAPQINAMAKHLTGLRRLSLMFNEIAKPFDGVWETVGPTLQELAILEMSSETSTRAVNYDALCLDKLPEFCTHIQKLDFELPPVSVRESLVKLFVSYGEQLRTLILIRCGLLTSDLVKVCAACPKVRLDLAEFRGLPVDSLIAAGKHASLVNFGCNTFESFDRWKLLELGDVVENLSGFCVSAYSSRVVEGIELVFKHVKPQLTFARIENDNGLYNASVYDIIGNRFMNLEQIEITERLPDFKDLEKLGPLCPKVKELIFLNINMAGRMKMCGCKSGRIFNFPQNAEEKTKLLFGFIKAVQSFPGLVDVDFSCTLFEGAKSGIVSKMKDALKIRPGRRLCVTMCGNNYF